MGESSQQGTHFKPIAGGRAGYKGVKITLPFCFFLYGNGNSFPPRFLKLMPDPCLALSETCLAFIRICSITEVL